jgi:hypothetical protein
VRFQVPARVEGVGPLPRHLGANGVACVPFQAYSWNHFVLEFQRTWNDHAFLIDVIIKGQRYYFNRVFQPL